MPSRRPRLPLLVLPAAHRLHRTADFTAAVRSGARRGAPRLVVHHLAGDSAEPALVGLVVSRQVGGSVVRHRVARRLRAQLAPWAGRLPAGSRTVVRALPRAADATSAQLGTDLERALTRWIGSTGVGSVPAGVARVAAATALGPGRS